MHANYDPNRNYKKKTEFYDFLKIHIFDGIITDQTAHDTLVKKYGCTSDKISPYNVMKMRSHDFERIFVFYNANADGSKPVKDNIIHGEKKMDKFVKAMNLLCKILSQYDESLYGQMAEIKELKRPEANMIDFNELKKHKQ